MIPKIKSIFPCDNYELQVIFDDGKEVLYDVKEDIEKIPSYRILKTEYCLFKNFTLDESRTVVSWSDEVDLPSDIIYNYGKSI